MALLTFRKLYRLRSSSDGDVPVVDVPRTESCFWRSPSPPGRMRAFSVCELESKPLQRVGACECVAKDIVLSGGTTDTCNS